MNAVVVTGVSSGIGLGIAKSLAGKGIHVFGSVRRPTDGERVRQEVGALFTPLIFDVTDEDAVKAGAAEVRRMLSGKTMLEDLVSSRCCRGRGESGCDGRNRNDLKDYSADVSLHGTWIRSNCAAAGTRSLKYRTATRDAVNPC